MTLVTNTRMYAVTPAAKAAWQRLFKWVAERSGIDLQLVDHDPPLLLADLWSRDDLGAVMMCGLPFARRQTPPVVLAQCVPSPPRYAGRAVYATDIVVAADSPFETLPDTFGHRAGYTLKDSQSGYYAFRHHLLTQHAATPDPYKNIMGGLMNARGVIRAIADGRIDVGPLDGYVHDLLRRSDVDFARQVRIIAQTEFTPMPPVVTTANLDDDTVRRLRDSFTEVARAPELAGARDTLLLAGFALPRPETFDALVACAQLVDDAPQWPWPAREPCKISPPPPRNDGDRHEP